MSRTFHVEACKSERFMAVSPVVPESMVVPRARLLSTVPPAETFTLSTRVLSLGAHAVTSANANRGTIIRIATIAILLLQAELLLALCVQGSSVITRSARPADQWC